MTQREKRRDTQHEHIKAPESPKRAVVLYKRVDFWMKKKKKEEEEKKKNKPRTPPFAGCYRE